MRIVQQGVVAGEGRRAVQAIIVVAAALENQVAVRPQFQRLLKCVWGRQGQASVLSGWECARCGVMWKPEATKNC